KAIVAGLCVCVVASAARGHSAPQRSEPLPAPRSPIISVVVLPAALRGLMGALWVSNNRHWDELAGQNTLTQALGTGTPAQRGYLGCLVGDVVGDTLFVRRLVEASDLKQLQFAVAGNCDTVEQLVGTFHT